MAPSANDDFSTRAANRWSRIEALYHAALKLDDDQRAAFLAVGSCASEVVKAQQALMIMVHKGSWLHQIPID